MKRVLLIIILLLSGLLGFSQKTEIWMYSDSTRLGRGLLNTSNDSVLTFEKRKPLQLKLTLNQYRTYGISTIKWDDISAIKIRDRTVHNFGRTAGASVGIISGIVLTFNWYKKNKPSNDLERAFMVLELPMLAGAYIGAGMWAGAITGGLITSYRIPIPLSGKSASEKNQALQQKLRKKNNK